MSKYKTIPSLLTKSQMREQFLNEWAKPICNKVLSDLTDIKCCVVAIGQYYSDEATNAIHAKIFPSLKDFSSFKDLFSQDIYKDNFYNYKNKTFLSFNKILQEFSDKNIFLSENLSMIYAFEEYCEMSHQDEDYDKRYYPYAVIDRESCTIIGKKIKEEKKITMSYDDLISKLNSIIEIDNNKIKIGYNTFKVKDPVQEKQYILYNFINEFIGE